MSPSVAMKGLFGLLPTPYTEDLEIHIDDLRSVADFCCRSGQHGIVWPVMVGDFWYLGEEERIRGLDAVMTEVDGRLPLVFGCGGISVPQILIFARAAQKAGVDSVVTLPPSYVSGTREVTDMYKRMADCFDGPIMIQNHDTYGPMSGEQVAALVALAPRPREAVAVCPTDPGGVPAGSGVQPIRRARAGRADEAGRATQGGGTQP